MSTGATTKWNIPLFGDTDFVTPIQTPLNSQSNAMDTALTNLVNANGYQGPYPTLATLNLPANVGTVLGQHAIVNNDTGTPANNGDYRWNGTAWVSATPLVPLFVCAAAGTQTVTTGFSQITAWATTPEQNRGFASFTGGALTITTPGVYDIACEIATPNSGLTSFVVTKNSASAGSGAVLQAQVTGLTAFGTRPITLAANDVLRVFGAGASASNTVQAASFLSVAFRSA